jgi:hypothetical protein
MLWVRPASYTYGVGHGSGAAGAEAARRSEVLGALDKFYICMRPCTPAHNAGPCVRVMNSTALRRELWERGGKPRAWVSRMDLRDIAVMENQCNLGTSCGAPVSSPMASNLNLIAVKLSRIGQREPRPQRSRCVDDPPQLSHSSK